MAILFDPTIDDMIACIKREIAYRRKVYARMVTQGKMTEEKADYEIVCMGSILKNLEMQRSY